MAPRLDLHAILVSILGSDNVYFQPPTNISLQYPCIVYKRDTEDTNSANNKPYKRMKRYQITVIDRDADSDIPNRVAQLPLCSFGQFYTADNLNHDTYNVYF